MRALFLLAALAATAPLGLAISAQAQWTIQTPTTADLRGIDNVGQGIVWASGTDGTVLRSEDAGYLWQRCTIPPNAEHLDFRGIQAFDANTAIVMSSGLGDQSRLYKTTDGCQTWKLVFTNPDKTGFFDAINLRHPSQDALGHPLDHSHAWGHVLGDPVHGTFSLFTTEDGGDTWSRRVAVDRGSKGEGCKVDNFESKEDEAAFAASNESLLTLDGDYLVFITGGSAARLAYTNLFSWDGALCYESTHFINLPIVRGNPSSGAFGLAVYPDTSAEAHVHDKLIIVGGDYKLPNATSHNAVIITGFGTLFRIVTQPTTPPHGYRSAVAYDAPTKTWITVGPNGTDISTDDGRNWRPLHPTNNDTPDADQHWNALSLPYAVGPHGRVGILNPSALQPLPSKP